MRLFMGGPSTAPARGRPGGGDATRHGARCARCDCTRSAAPRTCVSTTYPFRSRRPAKRSFASRGGAQPARRLHHSGTLPGDFAAENARLRRRRRARGARRRCDLPRRAGDAVVIDPMLDWGGDERVWDAKGSSILGMPRDGTFAEYVTVPAGQRLSQACALIDGRSGRNSARGLDGVPGALYARRAASGRDGADYRHRRRRSDVRADLCQARRGARDRHVEQRREARTRRKHSAPT